ncbi:hypothetical protein [Alkalihalobacterium chitinilyticum]|uniref:Flagellar protein FlgN n=1 Tax=Alkalihalobacterium chitinilyticum TaxID=2980103 RepID=A0ABT5VAZ0_9BACI|nr:hypothetical protein [Alkalihalobacterium chitinilyticum]MDE5412610.1 hypothetical protein [Alkalihalobacterium chitinilyticum]
MMNRITRISSLRANRIRANYVNRMSAQHVSKIEPLAPVEKGKNNSEQPSENYLDSYDRYYEKLNELKKEFKTFYHREQELLAAINDLDSHQQKIVKHTDNLISKYNQALKALYSFDQAVSGQHVINVRQTLQTFHLEMKQLGIKEDELGYLYFEPKRFVNFIRNDESNFEELLIQFRQLIIESYKSLTKIRINNEQNNPYEAKPFEYKGLIIEEET